jgi:hypothetical protein
VKVDGDRDVHRILLPDHFFILVSSHSGRN